MADIRTDPVGTKTIDKYIKMIRLTLLKGLHISCLLSLFIAIPLYADNFQIEGINGGYRKNVKFAIEHYLNTKKGLVEENQALKPEVLEMIRSALQPYGFYQPRVTAEYKTKNHFNKSQKVLAITIDTGQATLVRALHLSLSGEGNNEPELMKVVQAFPLKPGDILRHSHYKNGKNKIREVAANLGYLNGHFSVSKLNVFPKDYASDIHLNFNTESRYLIGEITVDQNILKDQVAKRLIILKPGEPIRAQRILQQQFVLDNSAYFNWSEILLMKEEKVGPHVPITIHTQPKKPTQYSLGAGYGTNTGFRARAAKEYRYINSFGHQAKLGGQVSEIDRQLNTRYKMPLKRIAYDYIELETLWISEEYENNISNRFETNFLYNKKLKYFDRTLYVDYAREEFSSALETQEDQYLFPGLRLNHKRVDNPIFTKKGYSWLLDFRFSNAAILSPVAFQRLQLKFLHASSPFANSRIISRVELGWLENNDFLDIPLSQRFFSGGDRSVRGYRYRSVGRKDARGNTLGGDRYGFMSIENEYLIYKNFGFAFFTDFAYLEIESNIRDADLLTSLDNNSQQNVWSLGVGLRWKSPVGMARLDFAFPQNDPATNFGLHLSIGPEF